MTPTDVRIQDAPDHGAYEAWLGDELAGILRYARTDGRINLIHTEVLPQFEGRGIGSALVRTALDAV